MESQYTPQPKTITGIFDRQEFNPIPLDSSRKNLRIVLADNIVLELQADILQYAPPQTVLTEIGEERKAQELKWGEQNHDLNYWWLILSEEIGEAAKELCDYRAKDTEFENSNHDKKALLARARKELIQSAAVIVNMVESMDRNEGAKHAGI